MKKLLLLSLAATVLFTGTGVLGVGSVQANETQLESQEASQVTDMESRALEERALPSPWWLPYSDGGFGTFNDVATNGEEAIVNMIQATVANEFLNNLSQNLYFPDASRKTLGNKKGDVLFAGVLIPTTPDKFANANTGMNLGYTNHRGWNNVWRYQSSGNLGAGMHDRTRHMASIYLPPGRRVFLSDDRTVEVEFLTASGRNAFIVQFTRVLDRKDYDQPTFRYPLATQYSVDVYFAVNRWNGAGTRVNDFRGKTTVHLLKDQRGPLTAWDFGDILAPR